ncbi:MAG: baseplate J/gp47 family protein, partial [Candidatus Bathyarchaeia archaeon]
AGNGYLPGDINILIDPVAFVSSVENISISYGGSDIEDDEHLRQRIQLAPEAFSNAGSKGAYEFWAKTAHQDIVDVSVLSPEPGQVKVVVLMKGGNIPPQEILDLVIETLNDERIRPLTDYVTVSAPEEVSYSISAELYIYRSASMMAQSIVEKARRVLESYADTIKSKLGQDIVPEQIIGLLQKISGVYRAVLTTPSYTELTAEQFAVCENIDVSIAGVVDG